MSPFCFQKMRRKRRQRARRVIEYVSLPNSKFNELMKRKRISSPIKRAALGLGIFCLLLGGVASTTQLLESASESLDGVGYLLVFKSSSFKRGDIVSIQGHTPQYVGTHIFVKRIVGVPVDQIIRSKPKLNQLTLKAQNGASSLTLPLLTETKEGQSLTPLSFKVIPEGYVFVIGDHPRSFDSRYEEFGLVKMNKIKGRAILWW